MYQRYVTNFYGKYAKNGLQNFQCSWLIHQCMANAPTSKVGSYTRHGIASAVGSYIGSEITKLPMQLAYTLMYGRCTSSTVGSYIGSEITKLPMQLAYTSVYSQCTPNGVGSCISLEITKLPIQLVHTSVYGFYKQVHVTHFFG
jgi:hypothetical protein